MIAMEVVPIIRKVIDGSIEICFVDSCPRCNSMGVVADEISGDPGRHERRCSTKWLSIAGGLQMSPIYFIPTTSDNMEETKQISTVIPIDPSSVFHIVCTTFIAIINSFRFIQ